MFYVMEEDGNVDHGIRLLLAVYILPCLHCVVPLPMNTKQWIKWATLKPLVAVRV